MKKPRHDRFSAAVANAIGVRPPATTTTIR
jgi:hypothetical protein